MKTPAFWYRPPGLASGLLNPLGRLYGASIQRRFHRARPYRAGVPVVCVGNLVAGGAGKTPVALAVADALRAAGLAPHFLTRGHGGREAGPLVVNPARHHAQAVGDEALLLASAGPTVVARDRAAGARALEAAGAGVIVMDDGFQNPRLTKNLSLVVVDGTAGFGNGRLIPAGPLREPVAQGLARADAVVIVGEDRTGVATLSGGLPILYARLEPAADAHELSGRKVLAFAGIGRPQKFFTTLEDLGAEVVEHHAFADHHPYRADEVARLLDRARKLGAVPATTAKDAVRLPATARDRVTVVSVAVVWEEPGALDRLIVERIVRHGP